MKNIIMSREESRLLNASLKEIFKNFANKIDYDFSEGRIPFTYHHDFVRCKSNGDYSRADIAGKLSTAFDRYSTDYSYEAYSGAIQYVIQANGNKESDILLAEEVFTFYDHDKMLTILTTLTEWNPVSI